MITIPNSAYKAIISICSRIEKDIGVTSTKTAELKRQASLVKKKLTKYGKNKND